MKMHLFHYDCHWIERRKTDGTVFVLRADCYATAPR